MDGTPACGEEIAAFAGIPAALGSDEEGSALPSDLSPAGAGGLGVQEPAAGTGGGGQVRQGAPGVGAGDFGQARTVALLQCSDGDPVQTAEAPLPQLPRRPHGVEE